MEIIVLEAKATRLTNSDNSAAAVGSDSRHCTVAGTAGRVRPCLELLRRDERPVVDLPMLLPKSDYSSA